MKFILSFLLCFFLGSLIGVLFSNESNEMFSYILFFNLLYGVVSSTTWYVINKILIANSIFAYIVKFAMGLIVLNLFVFWVYGNIPTLMLLGLSKPVSHFGVNITLHCIFLSAYIVAIFLEQFKISDKILGMNYDTALQDTAVRDVPPDHLELKIY